MGKGTADDLKAYFDYSQRNPSSILLMKPDVKDNDLQFKKDSFDKVRAMGEVIGVFENEPANINAMADAFPNAIAIFLDTIHSPNAPLTYPDRVSWVRDFSLPQRCLGANDKSDRVFCSSPERPL